jgi:hypothetical protein
MTLESPSLKNSTSRDVSAGECRHHVVPELEYHAAGYRDFLDCYPSIAALAAQKSGGKPLPRFPSLSHPCLSAGEKKATVPAALCAGMAHESLASWYGPARSRPGFSAVAFASPSHESSAKRPMLPTGLGRLIEMACDTAILHQGEFGSRPIYSQ